VSRRTERVARLIQAIVADAIQNRLQDPRIEPLTSVTRAEVSADLSVARVHVSVMADEARRQLCLRALRHAAGRLRSLIAEETALRRVPRLEFYLDDSVRGSFETVEALDQIMTEMGEPPTWEDRQAGQERPAEAPPVDQLEQEDA
jgi:ribosome-binding factor A